VTRWAEPRGFPLSRSLARSGRGRAYPGTSGVRVNPDAPVTWPARRPMTQCMVRPCVARGFVDLSACGLASMYPAFDWSGLRSGPSWISARVRSHYRTGLERGHLGHQGSHAPGRPVLHFVSSSRRPRQGNRTMSSLSPDQCSSFVRAVKPFLRPGLQGSRGIARRGRQGWPSAWLSANVGVSRPRLDGSEHGATLKQTGVSSHSSWHIRNCVPC
jgi:hypothetical protein